MLVMVARATEYQSDSPTSLCSQHEHKARTHTIYQQESKLRARLTDWRPNGGGHHRVSREALEKDDVRRIASGNTTISVISVGHFGLYSPTVNTLVDPWWKKKSELLRPRYEIDSNEICAKMHWIRIIESFFKIYVYMLLGEKACSVYTQSGIIA